MLAYFLATLMAIVSLLILYANAFINPKIHRQDDFLWSGLGLFYALILWICAGRFTGAVLLSQMAIVAITVAFIWENRQLRKAITANDDSNDLLEGFSVLKLIAQSFTKVSQLTKSVNEKANTKILTKDTGISTTEVTEKIVTEKSEENSSSSTSESELTIDSNTDNSEENIVTETPSTEKVSSIPEVAKEANPVIEESLKNKLLNIWSRILGLFRKSPEKNKNQPQEKDSLSILDVLDDSSEEIDSETTAAEVEQAIENLDLSNTPESIAQEETATDQNNESIEEIQETPATIDSSSKQVTIDDAIITDSETAEIEKSETAEIQAEIQAESTENDSASEIENIPQKDIIKSLTDLVPNNSNANESVESESESSENENK